jgi:peroxiredoxin
LGAQNSATMRIGLGDAASAESIAVRWPSGRTHELKDVAAGTWLTAYEVPEQAPGGQPFVRDVWRPAATATAFAEAAGERLVPVDGAAGAAARLRAYTTMATWCEACKNDLPQVALLRSTFAADEVAILGVPVDEGEDRAKLTRFVDQHRPAYQLMIDAPQAFRAEVTRLVLAHLKADSLPSTIVTDAEGRVLKVAPGVPTVSDLRRLLTARAK